MAPLRPEPLHPLVADLRALRDLSRRYVASHKRPSIDACRELTVKLGLMAEAAEILARQAAVGVELEAVARDLDIVGFAKLGEIGQPEQAALREEQSAIQRELDASAVRSGAVAFDYGRVVAFVRPFRARPLRVDCQDDAS